jgi:hypothetical protein
MANAEATTPLWIAPRLGPSTFGPIAKALMGVAAELFTKPPAIESIDALGRGVGVIVYNRRLLEAKDRDKLEHTNSQGHTRTVLGLISSAERRVGVAESGVPQRSGFGKD